MTRFQPTCLRISFSQVKPSRDYIMMNSVKLKGKEEKKNGYIGSITFDKRHMP